MWMVMVNGGWQPAATEAVIFDWIRAGTVGPDTLVRHSTWSTPQRAADVPALQSFLGQGASSARPAASLDSVSARASLTKKGAARSSGVRFGPVLAYLLGAGLIVGIGRELASRSIGLGALLIFAVASLAAVIAVGRFVGAAPSLFRRFSAWALRRVSLVAAVLALLGLGAAAGISQRRTLVKTCGEKVAAARAAKQAGKPFPVQDESYTAAGEACKEAGLEDEVAAVQAERKQAEAEASARAKEVRQSAFDGSLAAGRTAAATPGQAETAIAQFGDAEKLGSLPKAEGDTFAQLLVAKGTEQFERKAYQDAVENLEHAKRLGATAANLDQLIASAHERAHAAVIESWIAQADAVAKDSEKCDTPKEISDAWSNLRQTEPEHPLHGKAVASAGRLERCRKNVAQALIKATREAMESQRETWAATYDKQLLSEGMDVGIRLGGAYKDKLTITYALFNRAWAYKITDGGSMNEGSFLASLQKIGFRRVTFSDGFSESYSYDLSPDDEADAFATAFGGMGLAEPFKL